MFVGGTSFSVATFGQGIELILLDDVGCTGMRQDCGIVETEVLDSTTVLMLKTHMHMLSHVVQARPQIILPVSLTWMYANSYAATYVYLRQTYVICRMKSNATHLL